MKVEFSNLLTWRIKNSKERWMIQRTTLVILHAPSLVVKLLLPHLIDLVHAVHHAFCLFFRYHHTLHRPPSSPCSFCRRPDRLMFPLLITHALRPAPIGIRVCFHSIIHSMLPFPPLHQRDLMVLCQPLEKRIVLSLFALSPTLSPTAIVLMASFMRFSIASCCSRRCGCCCEGGIPTFTFLPISRCSPVLMMMMQLGLPLVACTTACSTSCCTSQRVPVVHDQAQHRTCCLSCVPVRVKNP
mmetsp:Transcript_12868/g.35066  ORF Transcript_12868/g.35066 Transcript_12868/m.35066 type:complete len:242 (+) Transcript_12868:206-931(+)